MLVAKHAVELVTDVNQNEMINRVKSKDEVLDKEILYMCC